jgi:hypothetical protein
MYIRLTNFVYTQLSIYKFVYPDGALQAPAQPSKTDLFGPRGMGSVPHMSLSTDKDQYLEPWDHTLGTQYNEA